jgi:diaminopimelate epimerase
MKLSLERYHGLGNDYLVLDPNKFNLPLNEKIIRLICDRNFGFGSDGILLGPIFEDGGISVRIYNPDGSEAEKSGNGVRIFSRYVKNFGYVKDDEFVLTTLGGKVNVRYLKPDGSLMRVLMGKPTYNSAEIPVAGAERLVIDEPMRFLNREYRVTCLSIGNPHCVIPMDEISKEAAIGLGSRVESAPYFPNRINMQLLKVLSRSDIAIEIYERGAGYTLASGSSSCAAASAAFRLGLVDRDIAVHMPGGTLQIEIQPDESVYMTGTVNYVGTVTPSDEFLRELKAL